MTGGGDQQAAVSGEDRAAGSAPDAQVYRWLFGFLRPHRLRLAAVFAISLAASLLALAQPYLTKFLIDDGLLARNMPVILTICGVMLAAGLAGAVLSGFNRWHYITASSRILFALRAHVYGHLQRLSPGYFARSRTGDLMARIDGDIAEVQRFTVDSALALLSGAIGLVGALVLMISLSWKLSLLAFILLPLQVAFLRAMRPRIEAMTRTLRERSSDVSSFLIESLGAMKFIQSVGAEAREAEQLDRLQDGYFHNPQRLQITQFFTPTTPSLLTLMSTVIVFAGGGYLVITDALTLGTLVAFTAYLARATGPVNTLLGLYVALRRARVSLVRVLEITEAAPHVLPPARPRDLPAAASCDLALEGVTFAYPGIDDPVLRDVSAEIPSGAKVSVTGASGAGKTTLIDLMQRHFDPQAGRILLGGTDLRDLPLSDLRRRVAVVAQDTVLFSGSLIENVRYAAPGATPDDVIKAIRSARVDSFAKALPEGYDTEVGSRGTILSGGQRQRVAIARALLQDPLVLVLDEATTGVDPDTEAQIAGAIDTLFHDRTRIVISHHTAIADDASLAFDLAGGRLRELPPEAARARGQ
ncbi:MAG: ABC transporter ATP-binding protein [Hyphomicrobiales bacterium]